MKKTLLTLNLIFFTIGFSIAQNFKLLDLEGNDITNSQVSIELNQSQLNTDVVFDAYFENSKSDSVNINVRRITEDIVPGAENLLCWFICHGATQNESVPIWVRANDVVSNFKSHYNSLNNYGSSNFTFVFFDVNNPSDSVFLKINYNTGTLGLNKLNSKNNGLTIFPNPANQKFEVSFAQNNAATKEIKITNLLGSVVKSQNLNKLDSSAIVNTHDLEDGVYFVQLLSNGKIENSKRLVVKH
jgi:hypothetical protein